MQKPSTKYDISVKEGQGDHPHSLSLIIIIYYYIHHCWQHNRKHSVALF